MVVQIAAHGCCFTGGVRLRLASSDACLGVLRMTAFKARARKRRVNGVEQTA